MNTQKRNEKSNLYNHEMMNYILTSTRSNTHSIDQSKHPIFQRPKGLLQDGHVGPSGIDVESSLVFSELTHDSERQVLHLQKKQKKIYALPRRNVGTESMLQQGEIFTKHKAELMDSVQKNKRYQMSNFSPKYISNFQQSIDQEQIFGTTRGGSSTRLNKDIFSKK